MANIPAVTKFGFFGGDQFIAASDALYQNGKAIAFTAASVSLRFSGLSG